jgi:long-chain acyl-CoA synthetase
VRLCTRRPWCVAIAGVIADFEPYDEVLARHVGADIEAAERGRIMFYTSGTTGRPKGVQPQWAQRFDRLTASPAATPSQWLPQPPLMAGESVALSSGPLYHAAPFGYPLDQAVNRGVTVVVMDKWDAEEALLLIERHRVTHTQMVATMFHRLLALPEEVRRRYDLSSLRFVQVGAAPTPVHVKRAMLEWLGPVIWEQYSGTEGGGTQIGPDEWLARPGSVGRPYPGRSIVILGDDDRALPSGQVGRIYFRAGAENHFEYWNDPEKTRAAYHGELFTLGDNGYVDADGYLFLTGRSSEVIITGGVNVYPAEIDAVLLSHPAVRDAAVVGVPSEEWGEQIKAVVSLAEGIDASDALADALIGHCRARLATFKCPRSVDFVHELPRSEAGKVMRREVRARYWQGPQQI